jgi:predicted lipoprotein with Yx(FWY)xxD motif
MRCLQSAKLYKLPFFAAMLLATFTLHHARAADRVLTPAGITTYPREDGGIGFADEQGMTVYSTTDDPRFRTDPRRKLESKLCGEVCLTTWKPVIAPKDAVAIGDWTLDAGADGTKQWAYKSFPLFTFRLETQPHQTYGDGFISDTGLVGSHKIWRVIYEPLAMPPELGIRPVPLLLARVLTDVRGMTAYTYDKDQVGKSSACVGECTAAWVPLLAPQLVAGVEGVWSTIRRDDGTRQWAHKGRPLYTFEGDAVPGEAKGDGVSGLWHAAVLRRSAPPPSDITLSYSETYPQYGMVFADKSGKTIYAFYHDRTDQLAKICNADCMKTNWHPVVASADSKASGAWSILQNSDGTRQWVYHGKAVYTHVLDKKRGDMFGAYFGVPGDRTGSWGPVKARPPS